MFGVAEDTHVLHIDSRYAVKRSNLDFYVPFMGSSTTGPDGQVVMDMLPGEVFKNVVSVELHAIRFDGTFTKNDREPYIVMDVEEINNNCFSNAPLANRSFAVIQSNDSAHSTLPQIKFDHMDKVKVFTPPLSSLNRLSFKFYHGGVANANRTPIDYFDGTVSMIFKIRTLKLT